MTEHIPDIYPRERQLNKGNTSDKDTSFSDLNIKIIESNIHSSVYDKRDDFDSLIVNSPDWVVMFLDPHYTVFIFRS